MNIAELEKIAIKDDGQNDRRFADVLKQVVNVPKERVKRHEEKQKKAKKKS